MKDDASERIAGELAELGLSRSGRIYYNVPVPRLVEMAVERGEGVLATNGALCVRTGKYTGRSPGDRYIVDSNSVHRDIDWGPVNVPMSPGMSESLNRLQLEYLAGKDIFVRDAFLGADPEYRVSLRVINELAWQNLFARQLFLRPADEELRHFRPQFTITSTPGLKLVPERDGTRSECAIVLDIQNRRVNIIATAYAGEAKKSVFTLLNYLLPERGVLPMHCAANMGSDGETALFFGLSGTGKTALSADPGRRMIGDDEHGWSERGIFNLEGGLYAKCIRLSEKDEPHIWHAVRFGSVAENVVLDPLTRLIDFDSTALTENTRVAYPVEYIPGAIVPGIGRHPRTVIFLTADAFGVLPPLARLTREGAMYHFLSGFTSKLAGTERGVVEPQATFSPCFGAPFMPRSPVVYARMLADKLARHEARVFLIDTGWLWGPYGVGRRIPIRHTRKMVTAVIENGLADVTYRHDPILNLDIPTKCCDAPEHLLDPRETWEDKEAYDGAALRLARLFVENFRRFGEVPQSIIDAGPRLP